MTTIACNSILFSWILPCGTVCDLLCATTACQSLCSAKNLCFRTVIDERVPYWRFYDSGAAFTFCVS